MTQNPEDLSRLADAIDAYLDRSHDGDRSDSALLERHSDLSEFLGPMLDEHGPEHDGDGSVPARIGDYVIERELGRGGMGIVYEAVHETLGRRVALKVLPVLLSVSPRRIERFLREARAVARLEHPNLVRVHEVGEAGGTWFFAMELVAGRNLRDAFAAVRDKVGRDPRRFDGRAALGIGGCASWHDEVAELGACLADALACAHEAGLVHRDVKPHNVLVGDDGRARLVDFGLAKDLDDESLTHSGDFAGTPHYAAPEQVDPEGRNLDGRADVFALGAMLYELLVWRRPFDGSTTEEILHAILSEEPRQLRTLAPAVPADLETIVLRALEKDRDRRYPSARALAEDLRRFRQGAVIQARPVTMLRRVTRYARRHKAAAAAVLLAVGLFVVAPTLGLVLLDAKNRELVAERDRARRFADQGRAAIDRLFLRVAEEELPDAPHSKEFRRALLADAVEFYGRLLAEDPDDALLARTEARARTLLATAQIDLQRRGAALEQLDKLVADVDATDCLPSDRLRLAGVLADRGVSRIVLGQRALGEQDLLQAEALCRELAETDTPLPVITDRARSVQARIAMHRMRHGALPEGVDAETVMRDALATIDALPDAERNEPDVRMDEAELRLFQADRARVLGRLESAENLLVRAEEALPVTAGQRARLRALRAGLHRERARLRHAQGRLEPATREQKRALRLHRVLHTDFPNDDDILFNLIAAAEFAARLELQCGRLDDALKIAHEARDLVDDLRARLDAAGDASSLTLDPLYAKVLSVWALLEGQRRSLDTEAVLAAHEESAAVYRGFLEEHPDAEHWRALGGNQHNHAWFRFRHRVEPLDQTAQIVEEAIEAQTEALRLRPEDKQSTSFLLNHLELRAECALRGGEPQSATHYALQAVELDVPAQRRVWLARRLSRYMAAGTDPDSDMGRHAHEAAFDLLERALSQAPELRDSVIQEKAFAPLHEDPRWEELLRTR